MSHLVDFVAELLGYFLGWRAWLCFVVALIVAGVLSAFGVASGWPSGIFIVGGIIGLVVGLFWEARVG